MAQVLTTKQTGFVQRYAAALFDSGEASVVTVLTAVASVRSALEWFRP